MLIGLVTKNSILIVEFSNQLRERGVALKDAVMQAATLRLRPILMTSFSTIFGILPIAIGLGAGGEARRPLGLAVVGGMLFSTFMTLLIVPLVYMLLARFTERGDDSEERVKERISDEERRRREALVGSDLS
jgi:multidrug efflux pump subunit AcrB